MMTEIPLVALGRLNHHARVPYAPAKFAIYAYKLVATLQLAERRDLSLRLIRWQGKCNRCEAGRYHHYSWESGYTVACRDCAGTGRRTLRFSETTLPDGQVWHHPWNGQAAHGQRIAEVILGPLEWKPDTYEQYLTAEGKPVEWCDPGEWAPNLSAKCLPIAELVALLNEVEDWLAALPGGGPHDYLTDRAKRFLRPAKSDWDGYWESGYSLDIGKAPSCFVCSAPDAGHPDMRSYGRSDQGVKWSLPLCASHGEVPFPKDPPPESLLTPEVRRWMARHQAVRIAS